MTFAFSSHLSLPAYLVVQPRIPFRRGELITIVVICRSRTELHGLRTHSDKECPTFSLSTASLFSNEIMLIGHRILSSRSPQWLTRLDEDFNPLLQKKGTTEKIIEAVRSAPIEKFDCDRRLLPRRNSTGAQGEGFSNG